MHYFEVLAKCGHVGKKNYVIKRFAVLAESAKEAAYIVRYLPRVKHDHNDAIIDVREIDAERRNEILNINRQDPYFRCKNIQDQRKLCPDMEVFKEEKKDRTVSSKEETNSKTMYYCKMQLRDSKRYLTRYAA